MASAASSLGVIHVYENQHWPTWVVKVTTKFTVSPTGYRQLYIGHMKLPIKTTSHQQYQKS